MNQEIGRGVQLVDLPVHPIPMNSHNPVHVLRSLLRGFVGADVTGLQAITNGQHIHTDR